MYLSGQQDSLGSIQGPLAALHGPPPNPGISPPPPGRRQAGLSLDDANKFAQYEYLGARTVVTAEYPDVTNDPKLTRVDTTGNPYDETLDPFGRVIDHRWKGSSYLDRYTYGYDRNSNRLYRENVVAGDASKKLDERYHYDSLDRLAGFERGNLNEAKTAIPTADSNRVRGQAWYLPQTGNWENFQLDADGDGNYTTTGTEEVSQTRSHNKVNEIHNATEANAITELANQPAWISPVYDAVGNMTKGPKAGMNDETTTEEARLHFTYDAWNRLVKVQDDDDGSPDETVAEYRYDGLHRRIVKLIPDGENWDRTDYYHTARWQVIEERFADAGAKETVATEPTFQYVWDVRYIDAAVLRDENKDPANDDDCDDSDSDERLYYCNDANMNVTALLNEDGTVAEQYVYDPYGRVTIYDDDWSDVVAWASSKKNEILYCGYRYDPETGLYHVRHRYHHPTLGRWTSREPGGAYRDGMNLYEYCGSMPGSRVDPLGTWWFEVYSGEMASGRIHVASYHKPITKKASALVAWRRKDLDGCCKKGEEAYVGRVIVTRVGVGIDIGILYKITGKGYVWFPPINSDGLIMRWKVVAELHASLDVELLSEVAHLWGKHLLQMCWKPGQAKTIPSAYVVDPDGALALKAILELDLTHEEAWAIAKHADKNLGTAEALAKKATEIYDAYKKTQEYLEKIERTKENIDKLKELWEAGKILKRR